MSDFEVKVFIGLFLLLCSLLGGVSMYLLKDIRDTLKTQANDVRDIDGRLIAVETMISKEARGV